jgi:hypothetical protein
MHYNCLMFRRGVLIALQFTLLVVRLEVKKTKEFLALYEVALTAWIYSDKLVVEYKSSAQVFFLPQRLTLIVRISKVS